MDHLWLVDGTCKHCGRLEDRANEPCTRNKMFLYVTKTAHFQTEREPTIQEISYMKAGNMRIYQFDENFEGSEFELVTDRGGVHETIERVDQ